MSKTRAWHPPPSSLPTTSSMAAAAFATGLSPSLRGNAVISLGTLWMSFWQQHCWGYAELAHFPGCPSDVLALSVFPHLPRVEAILAALNPCLWWRKLWAVCAITASLADLLRLLFCCSLPLAFSVTPLEAALLQPLPEYNSLTSQFILEYCLCHIYHVHHKIIAVLMGK